ncbi:hypothetical protein V6N13_081060 [Hibiscus sabdariffa]|uniref:Uncharacterized protein n=1 Tax=Hibiscus sabdariffa TaxID=183260 RepID=A0ABR2DBF0_9ROSI
MKREEEMAKAKQAMERKKKKAEEKAANADENADAPVLAAPIVVRDKVKKENTVKYMSRKKGSDALPRPLLKCKKSTNYWMWAAAAAVVLLILIALGYYYLA